MRFLSRTPVRTFIVYPIVTLLWELITRGDRLIVNPWFLPLMIWGYLQYLCVDDTGSELEGAVPD